MWHIPNTSLSDDKLIKEVETQSQQEITITAQQAMFQEIERYLKLKAPSGYGN